MKQACLALVLAGAAAACAHDATLGRFLSIPGTCQSLIVGGEDASSDCYSSVTRTTDGLGRSAFEFYRTHGPMVSFSGTGTQRVDGLFRQRVDQVTTGMPTSHGVIFASTRRATGSCEWTDPVLRRPGHIRCSARTAEGGFSAAFASSGEAPQIYR